MKKDAKPILAGRRWSRIQVGRGRVGKRKSNAGPVLPKTNTQKTDSRRLDYSLRLQAVPGRRPVRISTMDDF